MKNILLVFISFFFVTNVGAQFLMDMVDTSTETGRGLLSIYRKYDHLRFSGYIQPQFQVASQEATKTFEGGDFGNRVSNRFMLRRSRVKIDYVHYDSDSTAGVQFVFQFDANERAFTVRDVWGRVFENRFKLFSFTTGIFARPFGYEVNLSSSDRESPERGRMSQLLMKSERDLGAMLSFDVRKTKHVLKYLKIDAGLFNGQGINAASDFDNAKDFIGRIAMKPRKMNKKIILSAGTSILFGGLENNTKYYYYTSTEAGVKKQVVDSAENNIGRISPRRYYGADMQIRIKNKVGFTELRGEYFSGQQTGTANNTETPVALLTGAEGFYTRHFNGAYFYLLQHLFSVKHQLLVKYDWYDPNTEVSGNEIGVSNSNFNMADIKFSTLGFGYIFYFTPNVKSVLYYAMPVNEKTQLNGYTSDVVDNVFTCRLQFRF